MADSKVESSGELSAKVWTRELEIETMLFLTPASIYSLTVLDCLFAYFKYSVEKNSVCLMLSKIVQLNLDVKVNTIFSIEVCR